MTEKVMELVQLENGDIVLVDAHATDSEPLIKLSFSADANTFLQNNKLDVARVMLEAGIERHQQLVVADQKSQETNKSGLLH